MSSTTLKWAPARTGRGMTPEQLLATWQEKWGDLSPEHAEQFLRRPEVAIICRYRTGRIWTCIRHNKKLTRILQCVQAEPGQGRDIRWSPPPPMPEGGPREIPQNVGRGKRSR